MAKQRRERNAARLRLIIDGDDPAIIRLQEQAPGLQGKTPSTFGPAGRRALVGRLTRTPLCAMVRSQHQYNTATMRDGPESNREYRERRIRRSVGINALKRIRRLVDEVQRGEDVDRRAAVYIVGILVALVTIGVIAFWIAQSARP